jgi:hypothetical protein
MPYFVSYSFNGYTQMEVLETWSSESGVESAIIRSVRRRRLIGSKKRRVKLEIEVG